MRKQIFIATLLFLSGLSFSQGYELFISEEIKTKGALTEMYPISHGEFYVTRLSRGFQREKIRLEYYKNFELRAAKKAPYKVNGSFSNFEDLKVIGKTPYSFLSDKTDRTRTLFALRMDRALNSISESDPILEDPVQRSRADDRTFQFIQSQNKKFLCIYLNITLKGDIYNTYRYVILDENLNRMSEGDFQCETKVKKTVLSNAYLSNRGNFYLGTKEYDLDASKRLTKQYSLLSGVHLYRVKGGKIDHHRVDLTTKVVTETAILELEDGKIILSGMYRKYDKNNDTGIDGVFYAKIKMEEPKPLVFTFENFDREFVTEGWTFKEKKSAFRKERKGKGEPKLINYKLRTLKYDSITESYTGIAEQYYVVEKSSADSRGYITTTYIYYYNTLIVYSIDKNGKFNWTTKIPKVQVSANDYGYYSSITWLKNENQLLLLYNDNKDNYDIDGEYITGELTAASTSGKKHTVTLCNVNLKTGQFERNSLGSISPNKRAVLVPKLSVKNVNQNELLLHLSGIKGGQFGFINLK